VYPSLCEGFGLPVLEAFACGAPVVTSNLASLPEVTGPAAVLVDPSSPVEIAAAVVRILESPQESERLTNAGRVRARQYTWARCAAATEDLVLSLS
jgi:glycosyltransferase involved in cell wall biosynthesis